MKYRDRASEGRGRDSPKVAESVRLRYALLMKGGAMPLQQCTSNGKSGWKYGESGKCYTGPNAKKKAAKQAAAIHASGYTESAPLEELELIAGCRDLPMKTRIFIGLRLKGLDKQG